MYITQHACLCVCLCTSVSDTCNMCVQAALYLCMRVLEYNLEEGKLVCGLPAQYSSVAY
jgi:hypothetical protein